MFARCCGCALALFVPRPTITPHKTGTLSTACALPYRHLYISVPVYARRVHACCAASPTFSSVLLPIHITSALLHIVNAQPYTSANAETTPASPAAPTHNPAGYTLQCTLLPLLLPCCCLRSHVAHPSSLPPLLFVLPWHRCMRCMANRRPSSTWCPTSLAGTSFASHSTR